MPIFATNTGTFSPLSIKSIHATGAVGDFLVQNSLKFDSSSSSYLTRTPTSAGNQKTWTWSGWVKKTGMGTQSFIWASLPSDLDNYVQFYFSSDKLYINTKESGQSFTSTITNFTFNDPAGWYHLVFSLDTTATGNSGKDRLKVYVNGVILGDDDFETDGRASIREGYDLRINSVNTHHIGKQGDYSNTYADIYLSEVHFVDGIQLAASDFGEFNAETGIWTPIQYTGATATTGPWPGFSRGATSSGDTHNTNGNAARLKIDTGVLGDYDITITKSGGANEIYLESSPDNSSGSYSLIENGLTTVTLTNTGTPSHTYDRWVQIQGSVSGFVTVTITGTAMGGFDNGANGFHLNFSNGVDDQSGGGNDFTASGLAAANFADATITNFVGDNANATSGVLSISGSGYNQYAFLNFTNNSGQHIFYHQANQATSTWFFSDSGHTYSGTHSSEQGGNSLGYRNDGTNYDDHVSTWGTFATANGTTSGYSSSNPVGGISDGTVTGLNQTNAVNIWKFVVDMTNHKVWIDPGTGSYAGGGDPSNTSSTATFQIPDADLKFWSTPYTSTNTIYSNGNRDIVKDSPMSGDASSDTGLGGQLSSNYATWNPLGAENDAIENGNLVAKSSSGYAQIASTIAMTSGKWYMEYTYTGDNNNGNYITFGVSQTNRSFSSGSGVTDESTDYGFKCWDNGFYHQNNGQNVHNYSDSISSGDVLSLAFDADLGRLWVAKNGTWMTNANGLGDPANNSNPDINGLTYENGYFFMAGPYYDGAVSSILEGNFGARRFQYQAPNGFKCLCTANLPDSAISDGTTALSIVEWDGVDGTAGTVSGLNLVNDPGFIWTKATNHGYHNNLWDIVRGYNLTNALITDYNGSASGGKITSVTPSSFSHDGGVWFNESPRKYVAWAWDGGSPSSNSAYNQNEKWSSNVSSYVNALGTSEPVTNLFDGDTSTSFYSNNASGSGIKFVPATAITGSIELYLRNGDTANSTFSYSLDNGSTFTNLTTTAGNGSYVSIGNQTISNTNGIIVKHVTTAGTNSVNWRAIKVDNKVLVDAGVVPVGGSNSQAFDQSQRWRDYLTSSIGFHVSYPKSKAFNGVFDGGGGSATDGTNGTVTFTPPAMTVTSLEVSVYNTVTITLPDGTSQTVNGVANADRYRTVDVGSGFSFDGSNSITFTNNNYVYLERIRINGKELVDDDVAINTPEVACDVRANQTSGFSVVKVANPTTTEARVHGLTKAPEFIMAKATATLSENWHTFHVAFGKSHYGIFGPSGTNSYNTSDQWGSQEPNPTTFYVKPVTGSGANYAGGMIYYIWHSVPGFSAFGKFEGTDLDPGPFIYLGFKPALILLKNGDATGDWIMHDSTRSPYNEAYKFLRPNSSDAQNTTANNQSIDILSNGFQIKAATSTNDSINGPSNTITYCAWAENPFKGSLAV